MLELALASEEVIVVDTHASSSRWPMAIERVGPIRAP
jgi:hypothetical protein